MKEVSRGKKGVNFNLSAKPHLDEAEKFQNRYGYFPKIPEARGMSSIMFLEKLMSDREIENFNSREDYVKILSSKEKVDLGNSVYDLINGSWNLVFNLGHFRGGKLASGLRYTEKGNLVKEQKEIKEKK